MSKSTEPVRFRGIVDHHDGTGAHVLTGPHKHKEGAEGMSRLLIARADGSGDEGEMAELHCYVEMSPEQHEECDIPGGIEDMVQELLEAYEVNFNGDGGFWELTITTETRECAVEIGWYYTTSGSNTETETL